MFPNASPIKAQQRTAAALHATLEGYRSTVASWYDGTPRSIEVRIAGCDRLIRRLREAGPGYHGTMAEMESDRSVLAGLRSSLNDAHQDRVAARPDPPVDVRHQIEARAFVRDNIEAAHVPEELRARAERHADRYGLDSGFVGTVLVEARAVPVPKVASAPPIEDFPDHGLFM